MALLEPTNGVITSRFGYRRTSFPYRIRYSKTQQEHQQKQQMEQSHLQEQLNKWVW